MYHQQLTKSQERKLSAYLKDIKNDDEYQMTMSDYLLELFIPAKIGIRENGLNVKELMSSMGFSSKDYKDLCKFRTTVSNFVSSMVKEGYAFTGVKDKGELKKYGFATRNEFEEAMFDRKERCAKEISNTLHYLDMDDKLTTIGKSFLKEIDKQLLLNFNENTDSHKIS